MTGFFQGMRRNILHIFQALARVVCYPLLSWFKEQFMSRLGRARCNIQMISDKTSQKGIGCIKAKNLLIYILWYKLMKIYQPYHKRILNYCMNFKHIVYNDMARDRNHFSVFILSITPSRQVCLDFFDKNWYDHTKHSASWFTRIDTSW